VLVLDYFSKSSVLACLLRRGMDGCRLQQLENRWTLALSGFPVKRPP
jgi:hypothetical protein